LLGICGNEADTRFVEELIRHSQVHQQFKPGLDAALGCYLTLGGERALAAIERDYLGNPAAEYTDTYSAIMAIRVHGTELDQFPQARLAAALRLVLNRPPLAELVIPDLARWEDWSVIDRLTEPFVNAGPDNGFIRVPIAHYMLVCPLPEANAAIQRLRQVDPQAVDQAEYSVASPSNAPAAARRRDPPTLIPPAALPPSTDTRGAQSVSGSADASAERPAAATLWKGLILLAGIGVCVGAAVMLLGRRSPSLGPQSANEPADDVPPPRNVPKADQKNGFAEGPYNREM
jgi:hypothetical protein